MKTRENIGLICDLGNALVNVCNVVPNGVVVFFTSYAYEALVYRVWQKHGIVARLTARKALFRERRADVADDNNNNNNDNDKNDDFDDDEHDNNGDLLSRYSAAARIGTGALLCAVMGGRLSEGINFADELARAVIVVGVPYAPVGDALIEERVKRTHAAATLGTATSIDATRTRLYDDMAMKTVNQSIGRALRHRADHAAIVLCDERYRRASLRARLPAWIRRSLDVSRDDNETFGQCLRRLADFQKSFANTNK